MHPYVVGHDGWKPGGEDRRDKGVYKSTRDPFSGDVKIKEPRLTLQKSMLNSGQSGRLKHPTGCR